MIVKNRLLNFGDNVIFQNNDWFSFSLDSLLLSNFVKIKLTDKNILDMCSGNAPIPMLLTFRTNAKIYGIELQKEVFDLGKKSILENNMNNQIDFINDNIKNLSSYFKSEYFDVITCNPPYFAFNKDSYLNDNYIKTIARHEIEINLEEIISYSKVFLKNGGTLSLVHRPDRLIQIINLMQKYNIEPKRMRLVYPKKNKAANILLIEGVKNGNPGLKVLPPLITHDNSGGYSLEVKSMFGDDFNVAE